MRPSAAVRPVPADPFARVIDAERLVDHGLGKLRRLALGAVAAGLRAADPATAVRALVRLDGGVLSIGSWQAELDAFDRVLLLGAGKASLGIATELEGILGARLSGGVLVRRRGAGGNSGCIALVDADHPLPTAASHEAGRRLLEAATTIGPRDLVLSAFTGGSSALACYPAPGITFAAKRDLHRRLLASGASIAEINVVRKHTSAIKGGRLAAAMRGATIVNLTVSDVVGDHVDLICDPVVQDTSTAEEARAVLRRYELWHEVAPDIRAHLATPAADSPDLGDADITTVVLTRGATVVEQMAAAVRAAGAEPVVVGTTLEGEAAALGGALASLASESARYGRPFARDVVLLGAGGEATVTMRSRSSAGTGGPNQEAATAFASTVGRLGGDAAAVFVDSDGLDGGTPAAGGCVDSTTSAAASSVGIDLALALARHDTLPALDRLGDLVRLGQTGTNVSDIWAVAIGGEQR